MKTLRVRNVHEALQVGLRSLAMIGVERNSRNGPVVLFPEPVTTIYEQPMEKVIFWPERDANPFFHLMESMWMLAGRNDVEFVAHYVKRMREFSDDGETFNAAYGYRWRRHFGKDQLTYIIDALRRDPDDRRQMLGIWDASHDCGLKSKDLPCNVGVHFQINLDGALDMTVFNRSNDIVWGAYGANAVHFAFLQEYVAGAIGVPVGIYRQVSDNLHAYVDVLDKVAPIAILGDDPNPYEHMGMFTHSLLGGSSVGQFDTDLQYFLTRPPGNSMMSNRFLRNVAWPVMQAYEQYKTDSKERFDDARTLLGMCASPDWKRACFEWIDRREAAQL